MKLLSRVWLFVTPWTVAYQALRSLSVHGIFQARVLEWVAILYSQSYGSSSSHEQIRELDHREGCMLKNWYFPIGVLEKTLESPLDSKEIKPVNPKGNKPWILTGRTDAKAEARIVWPLDAKSNSLEKTLMVRKTERRRRRGRQRMRRLRWNHRLNGHESEQTLGDGEGQGSLVCCSPWGHKESDMTEWLNKNNNYYKTAGEKNCTELDKLITLWE